MKGLRRLVFIVVVGLLVAAIPVSATASESWLQGSVREGEVAFDHQLTQAIATGLDPAKADQLMWRYSQVAAEKPGAWWQAPATQHHQLDQLQQLRDALSTSYQQSLQERRDGFLRALRQWDALLVEATNGGVVTDDVSDTHVRFAAYAGTARTPNEFQNLAQVLGGQAAILNDRLSAYRTARTQVDVALQNARAVLSSAGQYRQLDLSGFSAALDSAQADLGAVHSAAGFQPVQDRIQQTAVAIQALLNSRASAYSQLAAAQSVLGTAQSMGVAGNSAGIIAGLGAQLPYASTQSGFDSITGQLSQQQQALRNAIWQKENQVVAASLGAGKVIVVSLSRQALTAYQDGAAVLTTLVATGRPALPTPAGVYHVFSRQYHFYMVSPWPVGSPYWYPNSFVNFGLEFAGGGYFVHDAPWRSWYGPGSNIYNGTHGCVNVPYSPMLYLWNWAPIGTTVIVQY
ncbi:MAG TPA: L,D-transpeptidase family protein [Candidatus Limnocylindrales bacterium]|nr:L,D-transpeptidase family protein [Candidatus Limnocylindrales bacterium]